MTAELTIGAFSRITHLSVKTLRHYHDWGLLEPAAVDPDSGYRYYATAQVTTAQTIRRFRDLEMPIEQVKMVLAAPDTASRDELIAEHLRRMEEQLARTQGAVASLRALVEGRMGAPAIEHVVFAPLDTLAITETVQRGEIALWWPDAFAELHGSLRSAGLRPAGPPSGMYAHALFEDDLGECTVYLPVESPAHPSAHVSGRAQPLRLGARNVAIAVHRGPHADSDLVYAALGTHVSELGIDGGGPVYERYLSSELDEPDPTRWRTEIGWPISSTPAP